MQKSCLHLLARYSFSLGLRVKVGRLASRNLSTNHIAPPSIARYFRSGVLFTVFVTAVAALEIAPSYAIPVSKLDNRK
jgi:hypothetical protein